MALPVEFTTSLNTSPHSTSDDLEYLTQILSHTHARGVYWTPVIDLISSTGLWDTAERYAQVKPSVTIQLLLSALSPSIATATEEETNSLLCFRSPALLEVIARHTPHVHLFLTYPPSYYGALFENPHLDAPQRYSLIKRALPSSPPVVKAYIQSLERVPLSAPELDLFLSLSSIPKPSGLDTSAVPPEVALWYSALAQDASLIPLLANALVDFPHWPHSHINLLNHLLTQLPPATIFALLDKLVNSHHTLMASAVIFELLNVTTRGTTRTTSTDAIINHSVILLKSAAPIYLTECRWETILRSPLVTGYLATLALESDSTISMRRLIALSGAVTDRQTRAKLLSSPSDKIILERLLNTSIDESEYNRLLSRYALKQPEDAVAHLMSSNRPQLSVSRKNLARVLKGLGTSRDPSVRNQIMTLLAALPPDPVAGPRRL